MAVDAVSEEKVANTIVASSLVDLERLEKTVATCNDAETSNGDEQATVSTTNPILDPQHSPYNWPAYRKVSIALVVSLGQLIQLMSASMMAAALPRMAQDLQMSGTETQVSFSIYILGLAFAPFLIGPSSELFGRKPVWIVCNLFYVLWNTLCPVGRSRALLIVSRFLAGSGASCGTTLTGPIMADMYGKENRGKSLALATLLPYLGPALGPIVGGVASQNLSWPWLFWILSIFDTVLILIGWLVIRETYTPILLERQSRKSQIQNDKWKQLLARSSASFARPVKMLVQRPIVPLMSFIMAVEFGVYTLVLSIYASIFIQRYHESPTTSSLHYIAIALGAVIASQGGGILMDYVFRRLKRRSTNGQTSPEFRVPLLALGTAILPMGLFWLGWSAKGNASWVMVDLGTAIFTCGCFITAQAVLAYLLDEFTVSAASANAAARMLSNVLGFAFPLFAPKLFDSLGYGWGCSLLAFVWIVLAVPMPFLLWIWGAKLRAVGRKDED